MFVVSLVLAPLVACLSLSYMSTHPGEADLPQLREAITPKMQRAVELYVSGPPACLGSKVNAYSAAYDWNGSRRGAQVKASALYARPDVDAYVRALRAAGTAGAAGQLREWSELAPDAQETLHKAATGDLPRGLSDEAVRSAVRAASYIIDRAFGTPSQQIELRQTGGIVVHVAGPETVGRMIAASTPCDGPAGLPDASQVPRLGPASAVDGVDGVPGSPELDP